ncbi:MAG: class IV adenylate cyclase [Planctomycetota bacterium]
MYEVEQKFRVADPAAIEARLVALAARFREPVEQVDRYFAHPSRDFAKTDEALRVRRVGDDVAVTWKGPRIDSASKTRRELELALAPVPPLPGGPRGGQATLDRWTELLEALGFRRVRDVAKRRRTARVPWQGTEIEAALDHVAGLGDYLELELQAAAGEVPLASACVESLAHRLGCGEQERRSYLELVIAAGR